MLFGNVLVAFMILVIALSIAGILASEANVSIAIALIIVSLIVIALIKVPKKHYNPAPYRVRV